MKKKIILSTCIATTLIAAIVVTCLFVPETPSQGNKPERDSTEIYSPDSQSHNADTIVKTTHKYDYEYKHILTEMTWEKGKYERYIDKLRAADSTLSDIWDERLFFDTRQMKFANDIEYADSYKTYFGLLNEYFPITLPASATGYDLYLASKQQYDSLTSFHKYVLTTYDLYCMEDDYERFLKRNIERFTDLSKQQGIYSKEVDDAWKDYMNKIVLAFDSIELGYWHCRGRESNLELSELVDRLEQDYLYAILETMYYKQVQTKHETVTDQMITDAYQLFRDHQYDDDWHDQECAYPYSVRIELLNSEEQAWNEFISARKRKEDTLTGKQKEAYHNATNNFKRSKLWILKNEYRMYCLCEYSFSLVLLDYNCTDEELFNYDFRTKHKEIYGELSSY